MTHEDMLARAREVMDVEIEGMSQAKAALSDEFARIVDCMVESLEKGGKIVVTGIGKNLHIGEKISATMASTGSTSVMMNPIQAMHGDLGMVSGNDVVLALSYSGESDEIIKLIPAVHRLGVKVVGMTGKAESSLAKNSDFLLLVDVGREACPFNMAPTTSTTATLAVGDALAMVLLEARGFKKENFALLHPAGAIGRALLFRVKDIMRAGERMACIPEASTVQDAIVEMTRAKAGCACVADAAGGLAGIFTDGDLRRLLMKGGRLIDTPIADVMTRKPVSVKLGALAVEVLNVFEHYKIDDLPVVDDAGTLVGYVDIQDLPRMKIL